ncbi:MAG: hypothetical protein QOH06_6318 [Acidobacteriota bacterium]|jgi:hypothetical protein|nr:hypothetical protein [Acidobacteriota bacterium]
MGVAALSLSGQDVDVVGGLSMVPDELVSRWQDAYRLYGRVAEIEADSSPGDMDVIEVMASASWTVAQLWREIAACPGLPWLVTAAVGAAAEAFEDQARQRIAGSGVSGARWEVLGRGESG